ncbi:MAG: ArsC/Spx/MgsR family protein [Deinococcales bacterium]
MLNVQIFTTPKSQAGKKAERFFKERNIKPHIINLNERPLSKGEMQRFVDKFGLEALINSKSKSYERQGLAYMRLSVEMLLEKFATDAELIEQPLIRSGNQLAIGWDEAFWRDVIAKAKG